MKIVMQKTVDILKMLYHNLSGKDKIMQKIFRALV